MTRTVLQNANIFDGDAACFHGSCIVEEGAILWVGEAAPDIRPDDIVHDLGGHSLMPGLITCHLHPEILKYDIADFLAGSRLGKERPPGFLMACAIRTGRILIESGFTGYVGAACSHNIDAQLKMAIEEDVVPGPRIRPCGHHVGTTADNNDSRIWWHDFRTPGIDVFADGPEGLRRMVREEIRCGAQIIKFYASSGQGIPGPRGTRNMSHDEIAMIVATAHDRGVPVRAHVTGRELIRECLELGVDLIDHGNQIDEACIEQMARQGTYWLPSLLFSRIALDQWPDPVEARETMDNLRHMLPIADAAGVRILLGDDYGVDAMRHDLGVYARELRVYADETGLDPARILRWGMINAGELLTGESGKLGVLKPGAAADLIILSADPTRDVTVLERPDLYLLDVMREGRFHFGRLPGAAGSAAVRVN